MFDAPIAWSRWGWLGWPMAGSSAASKGVRQLADNAWGFRRKRRLKVISLILDNWRRNRILYVIGDPIFSHYHAKDDRTSRPGCCRYGTSDQKGCCLALMQSNDYARSLIAQRGCIGSPGFPKEMGIRSAIHLDVDAAATILWELVTKEAKVLTKVTLRSQREKALAGDVWQVNSERLLIERCHSRQRCTTCQRITTRPAPNAACTRHNCHGTTVTEAARPRRL